MKLLVCGGRDFDDSQIVFRVLDQLHERRPIHLIIEGGCAGADMLAACWAEENGVQIVEYPVTPDDWRAHGPAAGPLRNQKMLDMERPDIVLAFPGGRGTADMKRKAKKAKVFVYDVDVQNGVE